MSMVHDLANYIDNMKYDDLSEGVVEQACYCILDGFGNLLGGERESSEMECVQNFLEKQNGRSRFEESTLAGYGRVSCELAAFLNAVMLRNLDLDDGDRIAMGHPGSTLIPTVLAVSEKYRLSGRDAITALVAGYETHRRIGAVIYPYAYSAKGFEATTTNGTIANAAAIAKLRSLNHKVIADAMGIAATFTGALIEYQNDSTSGKVLCAAIAASDALRAVSLAESGFTGPELIFEGRKGFFQAFGPGPTNENPLEGLGKAHAIMSIYFKTHACMRGLHATIDAALALREKYNIAIENIVGIKIHASSFVHRLVKGHPQKLSECQSNLFYCVGVALKYGSINVDTIGLGMALQDVLSLEERTEFVLDDEIEAYVDRNPSHWGACRVEIELHGGSVCSESRDIAHGEPEKPFPRSVLEDKFRYLLSRSRWSSKANELISLILGFGKLKSMDELWSAVNG